MPGLDDLELCFKETRCSTVSNTTRSLKSLTQSPEVLIVLAQIVYEVDYRSQKRLYELGRGTWLSENVKSSISD